MLINTNNFSDISNFINSLSYVDFEKIVKEYSIVNNINYDMTLNKMITVNLEERLNKLEINKTCPNCNSHLKVKNGKRPNGIQEYKCKECKTKFTAFTDTILEKSHFHWDIWVKILELTINNYSVEKIVNILQNDYKCSNINSKTIWHMRLKLIHSIANLPVPTLTGVIQIDETFVRESQKGSKNLISYIKNEERLPRYGKIPSKYGITGSEFATITTAIDNRGYSICEVSGLGRLKEDIFYELFNEKIDNPTFICTDGNNVYSKYSELLNIPHYIKPSNYNDTLNKNNYYNANNEEERELILLNLYNNNMIDYLDNMGKLTYLEFKNIKNRNNLSLSRVNQLHSDIKKFINIDKANVSTKFLSDYIKFFNYIRNWKVKNSHYPTSSKDIESIFIEILTKKVDWKIKDIQKKELKIPKPNGSYMKLLIEETNKIQLETNSTFQYNEENISSLNKREYLLNIPTKYLYELAKEYKIPKYKKLAKWSIVTILLKQKDINSKIHKLIFDFKL